MTSTETSKARVPHQIHALLEALGARVDRGLLPILSAEAALQILQDAGMDGDLTPDAALKAVAPQLPETYPGTGFRIETTPVDIRVTRFGTYGPIPASVRKAGLTAGGARTFLQGRASTASKLHFIMRLSRAYMPLDLFSMILDQVDAPIWNITAFFDEILRIHKDILEIGRSAAPTDGYVQVPLGEIADRRDLAPWTDLVRTRPSLQASGFNQRMVALLIDPEREGEADMDRLMSAILLFLHELGCAEKLSILTECDWGRGARNLALLPSVIAVRPDMDEADYTVGEQILKKIQSPSPM